MRAWSRRFRPRTSRRSLCRTRVRRNGIWRRIPSWFFETFVLAPHLGRATRSSTPATAILFNSYYEAMGERHPRPARGMLTRPSSAEVLRYRAHVDLAMARFLSGRVSREARDLVILGLAHEEQHQELILMDILNLFSLSPLKPCYAPGAPAPEVSREPPRWIGLKGGLVEIRRRRIPVLPSTMKRLPTRCFSRLFRCLTPGHERRNGWLLHGRRRLIAEPEFWLVGWLGEGAGRGMERASLLGGLRRHLADPDPGRRNWRR